MVSIHLDSGKMLLTKTLVGMPVITPDGHYGIISKEIRREQDDLVVVIFWNANGSEVWTDKKVYDIDEINFDTKRMEGVEE